MLILDEPTAALDTLAEQAVLGALVRLRKGRTTVVIAHRLSSVRGADRILVLDRGRVVDDHGLRADRAGRWCWRLRTPEHSTRTLAGRRVIIHTP